jgi:hypothetical protein
MGRTKGRGTVNSYLPVKASALIKSPRPLAALAALDHACTVGDVNRALVQRKVAELTLASSLRLLLSREQIVADELVSGSGF